MTDQSSPENTPDPGHAPPIAPEFAQPPTGATTTVGGEALVLAGWWSRVGAAVIDGLVVVVIVGLVAGIAVLAGVEVDLDDRGAAFVPDAALDFWQIGLGVLALLVYAVPMLVSTDGQTLGRMATGIRVVRADGRPLSFGFAALREVLVKYILIDTIAGSLVIPALIAYLWPLWDRENRAVHDLIVKTRVVRV